MSESKVAPGDTDGVIQIDGKEWDKGRIFDVIKDVCTERTEDGTVVIEGLPNVDCDAIASHVLDIMSNITIDSATKEELFSCIAMRAKEMMSTHFDYDTLWGRALIIAMRIKSPFTKFSEFMKRATEVVCDQTHKVKPVVDVELAEWVSAHASQVDAMIDIRRDFRLAGFGVMTLLKSYLLKFNGVPSEHPQFMYMRVSIGIHVKHALQQQKRGVPVNLDELLATVKETYDALSLGEATHATPTLFNMGTPKPQGASCATMSVKEDSLRGGILDAWVDGAIMKQHAFGVGMSWHKVRAKGSYIHSSGAKSDGVCPFLRVENEISSCINQGGRRKGSAAIYFPLWHADVIDFVNLKNPHLPERETATDLFYAAWVSDLFMKRLIRGEDWPLFCPTQAPRLLTTYGKEFEAAFLEYEAAGLARRVVKASDIWKHIVESQFNTGMPYVLYKDHCNRLSNQKNLGIIKLSNLCSEVVLFTGKNRHGNEEMGVCNLASVALPKFVQSDGTFDFKGLERVTRMLVRNVDKMMDVIYLPLEAMKESNYRNRPMGIGVQGLANVFAKMALPYGSARALKLDAEIAETMYYAAVSESVDLASVLGAYPSFRDGPDGSPASNGLFQFDLHKKKPVTDRYDWESLRERMKTVGLRNSLLIAHMPTASTANILGNSPGNEPFQANMYRQTVLSGEATVLNRDLVRVLQKKGLWTPDVIDHLSKHDGSIASIDGIPKIVKKMYRTVWEMDNMDIVAHNAVRAPFVCQSQSMNLYMRRGVDDGPEEEAEQFVAVTRAQVEAWRRQLKTGMYYLRSTAKRGVAHETQKAPSGGSKGSGSRSRGVDVEECLSCGA